MLEVGALTSLRCIKDDRQAGWSTVRAVEHSYDGYDRRIRPQMTGSSRHLRMPTARPFSGFGPKGFGIGVGLSVNRSTRLPPAKYDIRRTLLLRIIRFPGFDLRNPQHIIITITLSTS